MVKAHKHTAVFSTGTGGIFSLMMLWLLIQHGGYRLNTQGFPVRGFPPVSNLIAL